MPSGCEREIGLSAESAQLLAFRGELGDYFEAALAASAEPAPPPQALANWISGELLGRLGDGDDPADSRVTPPALAALVGLVAAKQVSVGAGRQVLDRLIAEGGDPAAIVEAEGLAAIGGGDELAEIVAAALAANPDAAAARARRQRQGDRADRRARDARDQGPRRRHRGLPADQRAARRLSGRSLDAGSRSAAGA